MWFQVSKTSPNGIWNNKTAFGWRKNGHFTDKNRESATKKPNSIHSTGSYWVLPQRHRQVKSQESCWFSQKIGDPSQQKSGSSYCSVTSCSSEGFLIHWHGFPKHRSSWGGHGWSWLDIWHAFEASNMWNHQVLNVSSLIISCFYVYSCKIWQVSLKHIMMHKKT